MTLTSIQKNALYYVSNTGGNAKMEHFVEDHDPIGEILWNDLKALNLVDVRDDGVLILTHKGQQIVGGE